MKEKQRSDSFKRQDFAHRKTSYNDFMTPKEKEFVAFLFDRINRKKERVSPDFYTQDRVALPELKKKEAIEEEAVFEGVLGKAIRKSTKKSIVAQNTSENNGIFIKKLIARGKIEEVYDLLNRKEMFIGEEEHAEDNTDEVLSRIKEIGEDLFNTEKGVQLLDRVLFLENDKEKYSKTVVSILMNRIRYIYYTPELCDFVSKLIPVLKESIEVLKSIKPNKLADMFLTNTAGVLIGHIVLLIFKKEDPALFSDVCTEIPKILTDACIKRAFTKIPHPLLWRLLSVSSKKMPSPEISQLKKRLEAQIAEGLKSRSSVVIENIRIFTKRCP
ncbi:hypothetical protein NEMIN01_0873 [Nematocida minor]|uniref:uncharacterized protein n=1 Tax=Nematocida minor TaxID=1912983 RepID=UPI00221F4016|nr:uncharacterized protein NEMIN01_0873 [Nematocida minor]KAI5190088.1 hypothetical protein NEMIN01_0873 [Nematocida minor]